MGGVVSKGARGGRAQDKDLEPIVIGFTQDVYERWEQVALANAQIATETDSSSNNNNDRRPNSNHMGPGPQDVGQTTGNLQAASSNLRPTSVGVPDGGGDMPILVEATSSSMSSNPGVVPRDFGQRDRRRLERLGYTITNEGTLTSPTLLADGDVDLIDHEVDLLGEVRSEGNLESPLETQRVTSSSGEVNSNDPDVETPFIPEIQVTEDMSLQNVLNLTKDAFSKIPVIDASFKAGISGNRIFRKSKIGEYFANKLEAKTSQATGTTQTEIDNFMERAEKVKEKLIPPTQENPCSSFYPKVADCYAKNKDDVTKCKGIVQQFANCVRAKKHQKKGD